VVSGERNQETSFLLPVPLHVMLKSKER